MMAGVEEMTDSLDEKISKIIFEAMTYTGAMQSEGYPLRDSLKAREYWVNAIKALITSECKKAVEEWQDLMEDIYTNTASVAKWNTSTFNTDQILLQRWEKLNEKYKLKSQGEGVE